MLFFFYRLSQHFYCVINYTPTKTTCNYIPIVIRWNPPITKQQSLYTLSDHEHASMSEGAFRNLNFYFYETD